MRSCLSAIIPSLAAALLLTAPAFAAPAQPAKEAAVPVQTAATSSYSGNAKTRIFHVSGCRYFNCKALHGAFQIRGRGPQQRIQTLQTLFGPRGQIGFGSLQGCWGGVRIKADHVSPLPQTCQRGPSLQSLSCVSPCSQPFPAQLAVGYDISKRTQSGPPWPFLSPDRGNPRAHGAGLSPQRPVSLRKTVTESRHPSLGPSDPEGSGVPSFLSLQLFSDRSAS